MDDYDFSGNGFGASPDGLGATVRVLGDEQAIATTAPAYARPLKLALAVAGVAGAGLCAYHGYRRTESIGWAVAWALAGSLVPVIAVPVAFAQGFGDPE